MDQLTAEALAASVAAAVKVAIRQWLQSKGKPSSLTGFVVTSGSLSDLIRSALAPLVPALATAANRSPH